MLDHTLHVNTPAAEELPQPPFPPPGNRPNCRLVLEQFLAPLPQNVASWQLCSHQSGNQMIIRFNNGYGVIILEYRLLEGIFEIAPLRFYGPGPDDHDFYFRSHVPDLTWSSDHAEIARVCEQIARLQPTTTI